MASEAPLNPSLVFECYYGHPNRAFEKMEKLFSNLGRGMLVACFFFFSVFLAMYSWLYSNKVSKYCDMKLMKSV